MSERGVLSWGDVIKLALTSLGAMVSVVAILAAFGARPADLFAASKQRVLDSERAAQARQANTAAIKDLTEQVTKLATRIDAWIEVASDAHAEFRERIAVLEDREGIRYRASERRVPEQKK